MGHPEDSGGQYRADYLDSGVWEAPPDISTIQDVRKGNTDRYCGIEAGTRYAANSVAASHNDKPDGQAEVL